MATEHPRIIRGAVIVARKDGPPTKAGVLFTNTYLGRFVNETPDYWDKLHDMIYGKGRLRKFASMVEDLVEKFSFLALARDQISEHEKRRDREKLFFVKFHTYSYVYVTKSFLDACAVFLNESYGLKQRRSSIALNKTQLLNSLERVNSGLANQLREHMSWFQRVVQYRNNLIHRHGLYVGPVPTVPESITDPAAVDRYIMEQPTYMPNDPDFVTDLVYDGIEGEFIQVSALVDDWINASFEVFNLTLNSFTLSFEVYDPTAE